MDLEPIILKSLCLSSLERSPVASSEPAAERTVGSAANNPSHSTKEGQYSQTEAV